MEYNAAFVIVLSCIGSFVLGMLMIRWGNNTAKRDRYMEAQIKLLAEIAAKSGVEQDRIDVIIRVSQRP